eukprot:3173515-Amphidinium_carterae.3
MSAPVIESCQKRVGSRTTLPVIQWQRSTQSCILKLSERHPQTSEVNIATLTLQQLLQDHAHT